MTFTLDSPEVGKPDIISQGCVRLWLPWKSRQDRPHEPPGLRKYWVQGKGSSHNISDNHSLEPTRSNKELTSWTLVYPARASLANAGGMEGRDGLARQASRTLTLMTSSQTRWVFSSYVEVFTSRTGQFNNHLKVTMNRSVTKRSVGFQAIAQGWVRLHNTIKYPCLYLTYNCYILPHSSAKYCKNKVYSLT